MERKLDKEKVEREAKDILDKFAKSLEKVEKDGKDEEIHVDRSEFSREEKASTDFSKLEDSKISATANCNFRKKMLDNAPNHDEDFIIAEKGNWK